MPNFLLNWRKGVVFVGSGKKVPFSVGVRSACQSSEQAGEQTILLEAGGW